MRGHAQYEGVRMDGGRFHYGEAGVLNYSFGNGA